MANSDRHESLPVSQAEIEQMTSAAAVIRDCRREFAARKAGLAGEITACAAAICDWRHYPDGEVYDPKSHAQYFFHDHAGTDRRASEIGHFHTFLRAEGMPTGVAPMLLPELAVADVIPLPPQAAPQKRGSRDELSHLIAIAVDLRGEPIRLFTTNRWVTGETWYRAEDVVRMLDCFLIVHIEPSELVNQWLSAMIRLFRPQISALLQARDEAVMGWRRRRRTYVFEDPRLEVTSSLDIDLDAQLASVDNIRLGSTEPALPRASGLPSSAEGWD